MRRALFILLLTATIASGAVTREQATAAAHRIVASNAQLHLELDAANGQIGSLTMDLDSTGESLDAANGELATLHTQIENLTQWGIDWQNQAIAAQEQVAKDQVIIKDERDKREKAEAHVSKIKTVLGVVAGLFLALLIEYMLAQITLPPPLSQYLFWIRIGAPVVAFGIGWAAVARFV